MSTVNVDIDIAQDVLLLQPALCLLPFKGWPFQVHPFLPLSSCFPNIPVRSSLQPPYIVCPPKTMISVHQSLREHARIRDRHPKGRDLDQQGSPFCQKLQQNHKLTTWLSSSSHYGTLLQVYYLPQLCDRLFCADVETAGKSYCFPKHILLTV